MILEGDCIEQMRELPEASIDAIVCDPPYGLEFMGKEWDSFKQGRAAKYQRGGELITTEQIEERRGRGGAGPSYVNRPAKRCKKCGKQAWSGSPCKCEQPEWELDNSPLHAAQEWHHAWATEALRVLKPGGHLLAFGGTRTYHRLACAVEDAGFEIRDSLIWLYGSGFPKSLDVSKAIDKAAGVEREVLAEGQPVKRMIPGADQNATGSWIKDNGREFVPTATAPATPEAAQWEGWGTALKPGHEPIVVARKPLSGTVAQNCLEHGTGALNIDGCRIEGEAQPRGGGDLSNRVTALEGGDRVRTDYETSPNGRWPANVVLSPEAAEELDEQSGERPGAISNGRSGGRNGFDGGWGAAEQESGYGDSGGASRFFYTAKASRGERNAGLDGFEERKAEGAVGMETVTAADWGDPDQPTYERTTTHRNVHPTVKPIDLMRWLVRLVTPPGGTVLDPFTGSGTTGCAAALEGFDFIGIEREPEYVEIAKARIEWWAQFPGEDTDEILIRAGLSERIEREHRESGQLGLEDVA